MVHWSSRSLARDRLAPNGFIEPCQPFVSGIVPSGPDWIHELKHDGWRIVARKDANRVRLWSRNGRDWSTASPGIRAALAALPVTSYILDADAVAHNEQGWPDFHILHSRKARETASLIAFDLLMVNDEDIRTWPLLERRSWLLELLTEAPARLHASDHFNNGKALLKHACA